MTLMKPFSFPPFIFAQQEHLTYPST
ncbi:hypothetical protein CD116_06405 [Staphylococcus schweitzeri]|uniref:Uncharacterized protein n=1 Tax=Staphylococcus schweitzeri TaxID=1654388 RepID=A0A2K4AIH8_9STAP|nr:hypothetical protein CKO49_02300 [Staphylococcus argenteus]PNZ49768.1 hypothetical protein CD116_06405 [Staphylococcus schweitzeri]KAA0797751.1 hypothetical protein DVU64_12495 [Staphylococcus argenteus]MZG26870.1 hypothetical protein [Staphylococcus argenteus]PNY91539.1 hypothetical protein CD033_10255 [Staphylococcus argenteus]